MNPKHPAIDRITGPHDYPVARTVPTQFFRLNVVPTSKGTTSASWPVESYWVSASYAIPIEPYADAILEPESEVFL